MGGELYSLLVCALVFLAVLIGICAAVLLLGPFLGWTDDKINEQLAKLTEAEKKEKEAVYKAEKEAGVHEKEIEMLKAEKEEVVAASEREAADYEKTIEQLKAEKEKILKQKEEYMKIVEQQLKNEDYAGSSETVDRLKAEKEKILKQREEYMKIVEKQLKNEDYAGGSETVDPPGDAHEIEQAINGSENPTQPESSTGKSGADVSNELHPVMVSENFKPAGYDEAMKCITRTSGMLIAVIIIVLAMDIVYKCFRMCIPILKSDINEGGGSTEKKEADFSCTKESKESKETKLGALNISEVTGITFSRDLNEFLSSYSEDWYKISPQLIDANSKESAYRGLDILYKRSIMLEENKEYWREIVESPSALVKDRNGADMYQLLLISAVKHIDSLEQLASIGIGFESRSVTRTKSIYDWCINTGDRINSLMDAKNGESAEDIILEFNAETGYALETEEAKALAYMSRNKKLFKKVFWIKENSGLYDWLNLQDRQSSADGEAESSADTV